MNHSPQTSENYTVKRINELFSHYIQQVHRVYKLPESAESRLSNMLVNKVAPVWVVDDNINDQFFIKSAFNSVRPDIPVITLDNGEELLSRMTKTNLLPRVVLLDLNMPRVSGLDILQKIRDNQSYDNLTVVVLTTSSWVTNEDRRTALALGADQFYTKPSTYMDMIDLIKTITDNWCD
ncbi:response regulator [Spirosoma pollinicola]|uniref:Response regulatory domain-containing protein n=1 Tax=Spirosoma pollinicola TaxID=2057025 RepID=A0A2K8YW66_9BACT|nr:response regulator [Spirosoma pollinicola]AUD01798.1 hypothetical protein CWM47_08175 [Spirosoma pollinicola]